MIVRRLTEREQNILVVCLAFVFIYLGYYGVYLPLKEHMEGLDHKIEAEQRKLEKNLKILDKSKSLDSEYNEFIKNFKQDKPNEQVMSSILSELEDVAGQLNLHISDMKPNIINNHDFYNRFSISLTIDSEFVTIVQFLHILQNPPHLFTVDELRFDNSIQRDSKTIKTTLVLAKIFLLNKK